MRIGRSAFAAIPIFFGPTLLTATSLAAQPAPATTAPAPPALSGSISVEPIAVDPALKASVPAFVEAVGNALAQREFMLIDGAGHARLVADLTLKRTEIGTTTEKVPVSGASLIKGGNLTRVGGGVNIALPTSKSKTVPLQQTRLDVRIRKRGENTVLWHGAALTVRPANGHEGQDSAVATDLSAAIFSNYPAQSEDVASIP